MQRLLPCALSLLAAGLSAQVPDGFFVWCSFQGVAGQTGVFFSHPRDPLAPFIAVTGLSPNLAYDPGGRQGASCVLRRPADGALIVGERAPQGHSVDLHVLRLSGNAVVHAQLFSLGTSAGVGEIPQCALLPDGRVLVAATDLAAGPLAQFQTLQYNWEGVAIVDTLSGAITPVPIGNFGQFPGVINAITASADGTVAYIGNWISTASGDLWAVPLPAGGTATQVATLPFGVSNLGIDLDGCVLVTTLNGPPNLFRYDPRTQVTTPVNTTSGPLNAITVETVTGNWVLASANSGIPPRSLVWMTPGGAEHTLLSPNMATISGVDVNPNPRVFAAGTPGTDRYDWNLRGDPNGLPLVGNAAFSLTVQSQNGTPGAALCLLGFAPPPAPLQVAGLDIHVDPASAVSTLWSFGGALTVALPLPNVQALQGMTLCLQSLHLEVITQTLAASPGVRLTVL